MVGLIIVGIVAFVTMSLLLQLWLQWHWLRLYKKAHYVKNLTKNVTYALEAQVQIDDKMDVCLNILEAVVITLGYEFDVIKCWQGLLMLTSTMFVSQLHNTMNLNFAGKK
jgi:hypothetical protein